jgi:hypothetical protein
MENIQKTKRGCKCCFSFQGGFSHLVTWLTA